MSVLRRWSLCLLLSTCAMAPGGSPVAPAESPAEVASGLPPEVRIRKMHLVRPDLIPYPIAIEVYC